MALKKAQTDHFQVKAARREIAACVDPGATSLLVSTLWWPPDTLVGFWLALLVFRCGCFFQCFLVVQPGRTLVLTTNACIEPCGSCHCGGVHRMALDST